MISDNNTQQEQEIARISLEGECTIFRAEEIKKILLDALNGYDQLELDLSEVSSTDLTFLQLLCSAQQSFAAGNKHLFSARNPAQALITTAAESGFTQACINCSLSNCALNNSVSSA